MKSLFIIFYLLLALASMQVHGQDPNTQPNTDFSNYILQPMDVILVDVYMEQDLKKEVRVSADGTITLPLIGVVDVAGMTVDDARSLITQLYDQDYLVDPQISVLVLTYNERRIYVHGQVNRPGPVIIPPEEEITLSQAISGAAGLTRLADAGEITIKRIDENGRSVVIQADFNEILRDPEAKDLLLQDKDNIYVKERIW